MLCCFEIQPDFKLPTGHEGKQLRYIDRAQLDLINETFCRTTYNVIEAEQSFFRGEIRSYAPDCMTRQISSVQGIDAPAVQHTSIAPGLDDSF